MINYRLATRDDLEKIAKIHINEFSKYFLSVLGEKLVCKFYESYYEETDNILVITEKEEKEEMMLHIRWKISFVKNY